MKLVHAALSLLAAVTLTRGARAEDPPPLRVTLDEAVAAALANHPRLRAARANESVAEARIEEAHTVNLPDLGVSAQINRSTGNTVPGAFFPTTGFAPIAGPTRGRAFDEGVWQTGASLWATWDVMSLARQAAAVDTALATRHEAQAATDARRLDVAYATADAFVAVLAAREIVKSGKASVDRARVFSTVVKTQVDKALRPGADAARVDSELAVAETQLARAEQAEAVRAAQLAEAMGNAGRAVDPVPGGLLDGPAGETPRAIVVDSHPLVKESAAAIDRARAQRAAVDVEFLPRVDLVAAVWLRGSGLFGSPGAGLVPDVPNWAAGAVATWSVFDIPGLRARARAAAATESVAAARKDESILAVEGQLTGASALLVGARRIAQLTPAALTAAHAAETQATARYQAGLSQVTDVADAQRLLAQAEVDDALARLDVRRAALLLARAAGDLRPFLASARGGP